MTTKEKVICSAYTGVNFCRTPCERNELLEYAREKMLLKIDLGDLPFIKQENRERCREDFIDVLNGKYSYGKFDD